LDWRRILSCSKGTRTTQQLLSATPAAMKYGTVDRSQSKVEELCVYCFVVSYVTKKVAAAGTAGTRAMPRPL